MNTAVYGKKKIEASEKWDEKSSGRCPAAGCSDEGDSTVVVERFADDTVLYAQDVHASK